MTDQEYIRHHKDDPVRPLALRPMPEGVNRTWVLQQIEGYQLAKKKLPHWAAIYDEGKDLHFPPRLSLEQCSSEATARYKAQEISIVNCPPSSARLSTYGAQELSILIDLTGGFGVDFSYLAPHFSRAIYVEQQSVLCDVARHNLPLLGISNAEVINATCEEQLSTLNSPPSSARLSTHGAQELSTIFFLDPARRDSAGNKVFCLEDCSPDITQLQDTLLNIGDAIMVKLSPMLDITQALRQLRCVTDVHVISVKGECKELLIIMRKDKAPDQPITFHCVNLETEEDKLEATPTDSPPAPLLERGEQLQNVSSAFSLTDNAYSSPLSKRGAGGESGGESVGGSFLFEPNASILKAGLQDVFGARYGLSKLHPNSNLFVGKEPIPRVPARQFRIVDVTDFSKANLKRFLKGINHANLTIRNFPATVQELRKRLKLKEGGSDYLFATTLSDGSHVLIRCEK